MTGREARENFKQAIRKAFYDLVQQHRGHLEATASQIGVTRQALEQYAQGSMPGADIMLTAFVQWALTIRLQAAEGQPPAVTWWECGVKRKSKPPKAEGNRPLQLPLFQAIDDLQKDDIELKIRRKGPMKFELGIEIAFPKHVL